MPTHNLRLLPKVALHNFSKGTGNFHPFSKMLICLSDSIHRKSLVNASCSFWSLQNPASQTKGWKKPGLTQHTVQWFVNNNVIHQYSEVENPCCLCSAIKAMLRSFCRRSASGIRGLHNHFQVWNPLMWHIFLINIDCTSCSMFPSVQGYGCIYDREGSDWQWFSLQILSGV